VKDLVKKKGAYGNRSSCHPFSPHAADGVADGRSVAGGCGYGQPPGQYRAGADVAAGSDPLDRPASGGGSGGHAAVFSLDVAPADVLHHRPVERLSPVRPMKSEFSNLP